MIKFLQPYKLPVIIAIMQWLVTILLQIDKLYFTYPVFDFSIYHLIFLVTKVLYLPFLLVMWCYIFYIKRQYALGNAAVKRGLYIFRVYIMILAGVLLLLWPGTWSWDDIVVLNNLSMYGATIWQHVLTDIYQLLLLQLLPFPGGIIVLQNILAAVCVAFSVTKIEDMFFANCKLVQHTLPDTLLKLLPFLLPPILMYQYSGYRIGLYIFLELVLLVMLLDMLKHKNTLSIPYLISFCVLTIIVAAWRTESLCYIPAVCLCLLMMDKTMFGRAKQVGCIVFIIAGFMVVNMVQSTALQFGQGVSKNYEVVSTLRPCVELVHAADIESDAALLAEIDDVVKLDVVYANPQKDGVYLYWNYNVVNNNYTDNDYSEYLSAFLRLALQYPQVVWNERIDLLSDSFNMMGETAVTNIVNTVELFDGNVNLTGEPYDFFLHSNLLANKPISVELRESFINLLGCGIGESDSELYRIVWNPMFSCIALMICWVLLAVKRKWMYWLICSAVVVRIPLVFLTQPAAWTMYWLSFYLLGTLLAVYGAYYLILRKKAGMYE